MPNILSKIFSSGAKDLVGTVGNVIDNLVTSKEEKEAAKLAIAQEINRHSEALEANSIKEIELQNADRDSARRREMDITKTLGRADYFQYIIGLIPVLGLPALVYYVMMYEIPQRNEHLAMLIIGEVLGFVASIYNYHYGSSMGSRIKDMKK